jgi:hypothetical protein
LSTLRRLEKNEQNNGPLVLLPSPRKGQKDKQAFLFARKTEHKNTRRRKKRMSVKIKTQSELDKALEGGKREFEIAAAGRFLFKGFKCLDIRVLAEFRFSAEVLLENATATLWENATATLRENATATLWGNATATLRENATATLRENATATLRENATATLWENATAKAEGFCSLSLFGKTKAVLAKTCHAFIMSPDAKAKGGTQTKANLKTGQDWCNYYGVSVKRGIATVYKGVRDCYGSFHDSDFKWLPGTSPKSEQWDDRECSHGLHFSPTPRHTLTHHEAVRFLACKVKVSDMLVFFNGTYPHKCKAPAVVAPIYEVDIDGKAIEQNKEAA